MDDDFVPDVPTPAAPAPVSSAGGTDDFVPDAQPTPAAAKPEPSTGNMLTDVWPEIKSAAATAAGTVADTLNPFSESRKQAIVRQANEPLGERLGEQWNQFKDVGSGLAAVPALVASPITGATRSLIGHPMASLEEAIGTPATEKETPEQTYARWKGNVDTAMSALAPARGGLPAMVRGPVPTPPPPVVTDPLGVTLSTGQKTGELTAIQQEQNALRGGLGESAQDRAQQFADQQQAQIDATKQTIAKSFDPNKNLVVDNPLDAADIISQDLAQREGLARTGRQKEAAALQPPPLPNPLDAADTVATTLRNSSDVLADSQRAKNVQLQADRENLRSSLSPTGTVLANSPMEAADIVSGAVGQAAENAQAATKTAYDSLRELPGNFHPASFNNVGNEIRATLNKGTDPIKVNPQTTPQANAALNDLDEVLGDIGQTRDPTTGQIVKRPPVTPQVVDDARKRLNTFYGDALQAAKSSNIWSDVRATRGVMDAFDDSVLQRLTDGRFIGGNPADVASTMRWARGQHAAYRKTFTPQGAGDSVGTAIQQIVGRYEGQAAPPNQISGMLYGNGPLPVKIANRLISVFKPDSPEIGAVKQGLFSYVTEKPEGVTAWGPEQVADRVYDFLNGKGRALAQAYLNPEERTAWQNYADNLRSSVASPPVPGDVVARTIGRITAPTPATASEVADTLFGRAGTGENPIGVKLAQHIKDTYGENSDTFEAVRKGMASKLLRTDEGRAGWDPQGIADSIDEFISGRGRPMANVLYNPEQQATWQRYADALRNYAAKDVKPDTPLARAIARITGRDGGAPATAAEVRDMLWGRANAQDKVVPVGLAKYLKNLYGETSPQWSAIKQGLFYKMVEPGEGLPEWGPGKVANQINKFLNVDGRELSNAVYRPEDINLIRQYADLNRKLEVPQAGANWSNTATFMQRLAHRMSGWLGTVVGAALARAALPFLPWGVSELIGGAAAVEAQKMVRALDARKVAKQMPLISDAVAKWQKSVAAVNKANSAPSRMAESVAAINLSRSLAPLGIDFGKIAAQGPGTAQATSNQQNIPRIPSQQKNGGAVDQKNRAAGGMVQVCSPDSNDKPESQKKSDWNVPQVDISDNDQMKRATSGKWMVKSSDYNSKGLQFNTKAEAEKALDERTPKEAVHKLEITPALRKAAISQGFPMFKRGGRVQTYGDVVRAAYRARGGRVEPKNIKLRPTYGDLIRDKFSPRDAVILSKQK